MPPRRCTQQGAWQRISCTISSLWASIPLFAGEQGPAGSRQGESDMGPVAREPTSSSAERQVVSASSQGSGRRIRNPKLDPLGYLVGLLRDAG